MASETGRGPGRPRKEEVRRARRRRQSNDRTADFKLGVNIELDTENYAYRWINAGPADQRIYDKTVRDDWEVVRDDAKHTSDEELSNDLGVGIRRAVGSGPEGDKFAYLCRKPLDYYEQDKAERQKTNDKMLESIRSGAIQGGAQGLKVSDNAYIPDDGIELSGHYKP